MNGVGPPGDGEDPASLAMIAPGTGIPPPLSFPSQKLLDLLGRKGLEGLI